MRLLIRFRHGLGDAVQLRIVLEHLRRHRPDWELHVAALKGKESILADLAEVYQLDTAELDPEWFDRVEDLRWPEARGERFAHAPATKAAKCLREVFQIRPEVLAVPFTPPEETQRRVDQVWREELGCEPFVLLHYQGNTAAGAKNLPHETARSICAFARGRGFRPVLLDWDKRSPLLDEGVDCFGADHPLWMGYGTGDGATLAALISRAILMIGIDSGPAHVATLTNTTTMIVWRGHHPTNYCQPTPNALHLVRSDWRRQVPSCQADRFARQYFYVEADREEGVLGQVLAMMPTRQPPPEPFDVPGLIWTGHVWIRKQYEAQDLVIVGAVLIGDEYKTAIRGRQSGRQIVVDIGAHIGCFALRWHGINPEARIIAVEGDPANYQLLELNLADSPIEPVRSIIHQGPWPVIFSSAVYPGTPTTGGSGLKPCTEPDQVGAKTETLDELARRLELDHIDVLKLDCEGAELAMIERSDFLRDRVGFIFGEAHDYERFRRAVRQRLGDWDYGEMHKGPNDCVFHLRSPRCPPRGPIQWGPP
jgi:FkbM family methyltransferase